MYNVTRVCLRRSVRAGSEGECVCADKSRNLTSNLQVLLSQPFDSIAQLIEAPKALFGRFQVRSLVYAFIFFSLYFSAFSFVFDLFLFLGHEFLSVKCIPHINKGLKCLVVHP